MNSSSPAAAPTNGSRSRAEPAAFEGKPGVGFEHTQCGPRQVTAQRHRRDKTRRCGGRWPATRPRPAAPADDRQPDLRRRPRRAPSRRGRRRTGRSRRSPRRRAHRPRSRAKRCPPGRARAGARTEGGRRRRNPSVRPAPRPARSAARRPARRPVRTNERRPRPSGRNHRPARSRAAARCAPMRSAVSASTFTPEGSRRRRTSATRRRRRRLGRARADRARRPARPTKSCRQRRAAAVRSANRRPP